MNTEFAPIARILLRYAAGFAGATGWATDQDMVAVVSLAIAAAVEVFYVVAKRKGGAT